MGCFTGLTRGFAALSRGAAKAAAGRIRAMGMLSTSGVMMERLSICRDCHLCKLIEGKAYCGDPLLRQLVRDEQRQGCGCPIAAKAADPGEHCPVAAGAAGEGCGCKWCAGKGGAEIGGRRAEGGDAGKAGWIVELGN